MQKTAHTQNNLEKEEQSLLRQVYSEAFYSFCCDGEIVLLISLYD